MSTSLETYKQVVGQARHAREACTAEILTRARAGDETAVRSVAGRYLKMALDLAEKEFSSVPESSRFDLIQEANAGIVTAIASFAGADVQDFESSLRAAIQHRLITFIAECRRQVDEKDAP